MGGMEATASSTAQHNTAPSAINGTINIIRHQRVAKAAYLYQDVARSDDDTLFMAYYFPQYHIAPENVLQFHAYGMNVSGEEAKYYTDWDVVKKSQGFRSFTPQTYYNLADSSVYDVQDYLASRYGVGVFIFYHYWLDNTMVLNLPVDIFMQKRRKTKFLGKQIYDSPEKHGYQLLRYFLNHNYLTDKHGRKPFIVYLTEGLDVGYLRKLLAFLESHGINLKVGSNFQDHVIIIFAWNEWAEGAALETLVEFGHMFLEQLRVSVMV